MRSVITLNTELAIDALRFLYGINIEQEYVISNRESTLDTTSIAIVVLKVGPTLTIRFNSLLCKGFFADFDGDEMNLYGLPQTEINASPAQYKIYIL